MRVYQLAAELRRSARELVQESGLRSHLSRLDEATELMLRGRFSQLTRREVLVRRPLPRRGPRMVSLQRRSGPFSDSHVDSGVEYDDDVFYDPPPPTYWDARTAAHELGVKPAAVRQWIHRGYLIPVGRDGPANVFLRTDVIKAFRRARSAARERLSAPSYVQGRHYDRQVTAAVAAELTGVNASTIRSWVSRDRLVSTKTDGRVLVRLGDVIHLSNRSVRSGGRSSHLFI